MKILLVTHTNDVESGWGRYAHDLARALRRQGHTVSTTAGLLGDPIAYIRNPVQWIQGVRALRMLIERERPQVLHIAVEPYALLLPFISLKGARVILSVHGTYAYLPSVAGGLMRLLVKLATRRAFSLTDVIVTGSNYTKRYLLAEASGDAIRLEKKIAVVPYGIAVDEYAYVGAVHNARKRILFVGALKQRKGLLEALQALGAYKRMGGEFEYRIVGKRIESAYIRTLDKEIVRQGLEDRVVWLGRISDEDLRDEYAHADLYLMMPTVAHGNQFEGFGLVYIEANACGVPVVGSLSGGVPEAIKDGVSGFCVDASNEEEAAQKIRLVLEEGAISRASARAWAETHDISQEAESIAALYDKRPSS